MGGSVTSDEIDRFFTTSGKTLPAAPEWLVTTSRKGERRCQLPVAVGGRIAAGIKVEVTVYMHDPEYLVITVLAPTCVARLCLSTYHNDRRLMLRIPPPHFHRWSQNRPQGPKLPAGLPTAEHVAGLAKNRDAAWYWFLQEVGIDSPAWVMNWPDEKALF
jgi:hypothetical protein